MLPIQDCRVFTLKGRWAAACKCGKISSFSAKHNCLKMLNRGICSSCKPDYRNINNKDVGIYKRLDGRWCSTCSDCGVEQAYTRKDHAKQSELNDWRCKPCTTVSKSFSSNMPVGNQQRVFNKFKKSAKSRGLLWDLPFEQMFQSFNGTCALTGWTISIEYKNETASLDRIDSTKPYTQDNIQWVHAMVNMCKNKYDQEKFVEMCRAVSNKVKW